MNQPAVLTPAKTLPTVLVVDDSEGNRLLLTSQLRMEGYALLEADGGASALEMAQRHRPDIILLDVMMPDIDGFEVCRRLKRDPLTHLIPVIMVTALRDVQYRIRGIEAGADEFLSRPHVREELVVRVRTLIELKQARTRLEEERNHLRLLNKISRAINVHLNLETMMAEIISQTQAAVGATKGNIMLLDEEGRVSRRYITRSGRPLEIRDHIKQEVMERGLAGWLIHHNRGDIIDDIRADERWVSLPHHGDETGSAIGVPLSRADRTVGVLILNHPDPDYFTREHLTLLETIGGQVTAAIENAYLFTEVNEERSKLVAILAQSGEAIITSDSQWRVALLNQAAEQLFAVQAADVVGRSVRDVPALRPLVQLFRQVHDSPATREIQLEDGRTLYASVSPIAGVGYAAVVQDVTELKRAEALRLEQARREKQQVEETFARYMGPQLVEHVLSHEPGLMARRERRQAVVMYADLRNSTEGMLTKVTPDEAIERLNQFFTTMMDIALQNEGTVFELTGDELLVGFNAPFDQPNAPFLALKTAVIMQHRFNELRQAWYQQLGTQVGLGIGIDQGDVVVGNVGAESRMSFRMVGEVMSRAHRLVELADDGQIFISRSVHAGLQASSQALLERIPFRQVGPVELRGFLEPQDVYYTWVARPPLPPNGTRS